MDPSAMAVPYLSAEYTQFVIEDGDISADWRCPGMLMMSSASWVKLPCELEKLNTDFLSLPDYSMNLII